MPLCPFLPSMFTHSLDFEEAAFMMRIRMLTLLRLLQPQRIFLIVDLTLLSSFKPTMLKVLDSKASFLFFYSVFNLVSNAHLLGTRVARLRLIFTLQDTIYFPGISAPAPPEWPTQPHAYAELYSFSSQGANTNHGMYTVSPSKDAHGYPVGVIIPLTSIRQTCMLIPIFPKPQSPIYQESLKWAHDNVLDLCPSFLVNNLLDLYSYQTIH